MADAPPNGVEAGWSKVPTHLVNPKNLNIIFITILGVIVEMVNKTCKLRVYLGAVRLSAMDSVCSKFTRPNSIIKWWRRFCNLQLVPIRSGLLKS